MIKLYVRMFIFTLFIVSCNTRRERKMNDVETTFISVDTIHMHQILSPTFLEVKKDLLIVTSYGSGKMIHVYTLPDLEYLDSFGAKGNGPDEIQVFPMICYTSHPDFFYIWGFTMKSIYKCKYSPVTHQVSFPKKIALESYETFNQPYLIDDSLFVYSALPTEYAIKKYNIESNRLSGKIEIPQEGSQPYFDINYGFVAANNRNIVYAYNYKKEIDIYDLATLQLKVKLKGEYTPNAAISYNNEENILQYIHVVAGEHSFYALYKGCSANSSSNECTIEKFNYDGKLLQRYKFDKCPQLFSVDEGNNMIYGYNFEYEDVWISGKLE